MRVNHKQNNVCKLLFAKARATVLYTEWQYDIHLNHIRCIHWLLASRFLSFTVNGLFVVVVVVCLPLHLLFSAVICLYVLLAPFYRFSFFGAVFFSLCESWEVYKNTFRTQKHILYTVFLPCDTDHTNRRGEYNVKKGKKWMKKKTK